MPPMYPQIGNGNSKSKFSMGAMGGIAENPVEDLHEEDSDIDENYMAELKHTRATIEIESASEDRRGSTEQL